jgi:hypothetical protein
MIQMRAMRIPVVLFAAALAGCASTAMSSGGGGETAVSAKLPIQPVIDKRATDLLKQMSDTLVGAKTMTFETSGSTPMRGPNGQWLHMLKNATVELQRPDHVRIRTGGDAFPRAVYFDGKTYSVLSADGKLFSQTQMPGTVDTMLAEASRQGGDEFTFADVLISNPYKAWVDSLEGAIYVGESTRGNEKLQHLALTGHEVDWEVWIDSRSHLPVMVYVKFLGVHRMPATMIQFTHWKLNPTLAASTFEFHAPKGSIKAHLKAPGAPAGKGGQS